MKSSRSGIRKRRSETYRQRQLCTRFSKKKSRSASQVIIHDEQDILSSINGREAVREEQVVVSGISSDKFKLATDVLFKNRCIG